MKIIMKQNPIDEVLKELLFSEEQKKGFLAFLKYAKICQETGNNKELKSKLHEIVKDISKKEI